MVMLASETLGSLLLIVSFFSIWLISTFPRAVLTTCALIGILFLLPFKLISFFSIILTILIIIILTTITEFTVNHEQAVQQRELHDDER
ncbi:MAG: hypothetical protein ACRC6H_05140 [Culicoidibacterales bacterium]